ACSRRCRSAAHGGIGSRRGHGHPRSRGSGLDASGDQDSSEGVADATAHSEVTATATGSPARSMKAWKSRIVALTEQHRFRKLGSVRLAQLKDEVFVKSDEGEVPGVNRRIAAFCWKHGRFRPRLVGPTHSLAETLETVANENAVALMPTFARNHTAAGVVFVPLADAAVTWKILVVWQRGKPTKALRTLLDALFP
ncbi:MAG: LysR substrate-binding domain-containing protein, partial [Opitutaceae bacterium]